MVKYKNDYKVIHNKDSYHKIVNRDDTFIPCRNKAQIYRYNDNTLCIMFKSSMSATLRLKDLSEAGITVQPFQIGDNESTYLFDESNFSLVADVLDAKNRIKRELTDEQKEVLRARMLSIRKNNENFT